MLLCNVWEAFSDLWFRKDWRAISSFYTTLKFWERMPVPQSATSVRDKWIIYHHSIRRPFNSENFSYITVPDIIAREKLSFEVFWVLCRVIAIDDSFIKGWKLTLATKKNKLNKRWKSNALVCPNNCDSESTYFSRYPTRSYPHGRLTVLPAGWIWKKLQRCRQLPS